MFKSKGVHQKLDSISEKLESLDNRVDRVDVQLAVYNEQLKIHIEGVEQTRVLIRHVEQEVKPVQVHVQRMEGAAKLIGFISIGAGIIAAIVSVTKTIIEMF